jgi:hypothetical protein
MALRTTYNFGLILHSAEDYWNILTVERVNKLSKLLGHDAYVPQYKRLYIFFSDSHLNRRAIRKV